jgi:hypothetical protein
MDCVVKDAEEIYCQLSYKHLRIHVCGPIYRYFRYILYTYILLQNSMLIFINTTLYNCSCDGCIFILRRVFIVLCLSFDRCVILCDVCYCCAVSHCSTTATM